jgi:hypothetical protein
MFQKTVTTIAIVILIVSLSFIGIALYRAKYKSSYPPAIANCPDYWDVSGNLCLNKNINPPLGNSTCSRQMDFTTPGWSGRDAMCSKQKWARSCNLTWDGISDNVNLCPES